MGRMVGSRALIACGIAAALSSAACDRERARSSEQARGHEGAAINLTGCLQKSGDLTTTYILTQVNEPTRSVGTSGSSDAAAVNQERMREAKHAYRLSGDSDQLKELVGKQVRVEGTIADNSNLQKVEAERDKNKPADIDTGDLAKVEVKSIAAVADACGSEQK